jgi:hypothetical protein
MSNNQEFSYPGQPYEYDDPKPSTYKYNDPKPSNRQLFNPHTALLQLRAEAELLRRVNPEMDEDEKLFANMVEAETSFDEFVHKCLIAYTDRMAIVSYLRERADKIEGSGEYWKSNIKKARAAAHVNEKQVFPEGTVYESKKPDELIFCSEEIPEKYKTVNTKLLRAAVKNGETKLARLVPSNEPPTLIIKVR